MHSNQGVCFFISEVGKGKFVFFPLDCAQKIAKMAFTPIQQNKILDEFYEACGRDCCVESPRSPVWNDDYDQDRYNSYNVNNCCNDHNKTTFDSRGRVISILIDHTARNQSHFGDWDDFDPHKRCRVPSFELPLDISKLWRLNSLEMQYLPIVGGIPPEYGRLENLKRLVLVQKDQWNCSSLPETRVPHFQQLEELHLEGFMINDETIEDISRISTLKKLRISVRSDFWTSAKLEDFILDLSSLERLENLEELVITVPRVCSLRGLPKLKIFYLKSTWNDVDLSIVENFLHDCPELESVNMIIPVTGVFSARFFEHPTLKDLVFHCECGSVSSIDFASEEFPPCKYSGELTYVPSQEDTYDGKRAVFAVGELPDGYQNLGIMSADERAEQVAQDEEDKLE